MTSNTIKILCADDSPQLIAALGRLFASQSDMQLVGSLDRADNLVHEVTQRLATLVMMDLSMNGQEPLLAIRELAAALPEVRVVVYSGHNDEDSIGSAVAAGAWGYVDKGERPAAVLEAIRRVARGEVVLPKGRRAGPD